MPSPPTLDGHPVTPAVADQLDFDTRDGTPNARSRRRGSRRTAGGHASRRKSRRAQFGTAGQRVGAYAATATSMPLRTTHGLASRVRHRSLAIKSSRVLSVTATIWSADRGNGARAIARRHHPSTPDVAFSPLVRPWSRNSAVQRRPPTCRRIRPMRCPENGGTVVCTRSTPLTRCNAASSAGRRSRCDRRGTRAARANAAQEGTRSASRVDLSDCVSDCRAP
jgi:hypothetical protein